MHGTSFIGLIHEAGALSCMCRKSCKLLWSHYRREFFKKSLTWRQREVIVQYLHQYTAF